MDAHLTMCIAEIHASSKPIRCRQMFEEIKYRFHYMHECFSCILREAAKNISSFFSARPLRLTPPPLIGRANKKRTFFAASLSLLRSYVWQEKDFMLLESQKFVCYLSKNIRQQYFSNIWKICQKHKQSNHTVQNFYLFYLYIALFLDSFSLISVISNFAKTFYQCCYDFNL